MKRGPLRAAVIGLLVLAAVIGSASPAFASSTIPVYGQRWRIWASEPLGTDPVDTIGSSGCVVTDVAMVQAAYGYQTNPHLLNQWLTGHGGYTQNDLILWRQAMVATGGGVRWKWLHVPGIVPQLRVDDQNIDDRPTAGMVEQELDRGHLVVVEVRLSGRQHFVVLTGHQGDTFMINDPWFADRSTLQGRYGPYQRAVYSAQIYYRLR